MVRSLIAELLIERKKFKTPEERKAFLAGASFGAKQMLEIANEKKKKVI